MTNSKATCLGFSNRGPFKKGIYVTNTDHH